MAVDPFSVALLTISVLSSLTRGSTAAIRAKGRQAISELEQLVQRSNSVAVKPAQVQAIITKYEDMIPGLREGVAKAEERAGASLNVSDSRKAIEARANFKKEMDEASRDANFSHQKRAFDSLYSKSSITGKEVKE